VIDTALWFSGGKDSMACLYLKRPELENIQVLFANPGKHFPELLDTARKARAFCPNWHEVRSDRNEQWDRNGLPADLVPIDWTAAGQALSNAKAVKVQSYLGCCYDNIAAPLLQRTRELGCNKVIRGQRANEPHRSIAKNGDSSGGITFLHPIENWTAGQVLQYLAEEMGELPEHYALEHSSMDCYDCTAFAAQSLDRVRYMRAHHPILFFDYREKLERLYCAIQEPLSHYQRIRNEGERHAGTV
jgi:phosphoadenosine phosphosulfate reductase